MLGAHSQTGINFPLAHSEFAVDARIRDRGVVPDYTVVSAIEDIVNGRDAVLTFALALPR